MGALYLVATPIGNLEDITLRALRVLREARLIAAEDTRHTRKLLTHFAIATPTISYHEHSPQAREERLLTELALGDVALVSDAGTPAISDPGQALVRAALVAGYAVIPIPGAVAAITALIASGLPTDHFTYLGFLPRRPAERRVALMEVAHLPHTLIIYEAPHRLLATLDDLLATLGDRQVVIARELTKFHEQWLRGSLAAVRAQCGESGPRGEYTLVVAGASAMASALAGEGTASQEEQARALIRELLAQGVRTRDAATQAAAATGIARRVAYQLALELAKS
ncbi:MAG TPA: 16S rRNA (cytidine(1402)-2'-O)-methyltransferase [Ktedonobacterales bacterium]|nr:16S rRNA (cytidine(1402)-2'-O)-methyltransferase [Ktedonobacterales bacterium]